MDPPSMFTVRSYDGYNDDDFVMIPPEANYQTDDEDIVQDGTDGDQEFNTESGLLQNVRKEGEASTKRQKFVENEPEWTDETIDISMNQGNGYLARLDIVKEELDGLDPVEVFEKLFDNEVINFITEETRRYAAQQNKNSFTITSNDTQKFIGFLLFTGYHCLPRERLYWCLDDDVNTPLVSGSMSRQRYCEIKKYFHLANNELIDKNDKMCKVRPLMKKLNQKFSQWGIFHEKLSVGETMVKYLGQHSSKLVAQGNPVRFGYKDWILCSSTGYCYQLDTYCGARPNRRDKFKNMPLGSQVVLELLEVVKEPADHAVFFDDYFTSHALLQTLRNLGFKATGTVKDNRTKNCPFSDQKLMDRQKRGSFEYKYDEVNSLLAVRWKDNGIVTLMTNYDSIHPLSKAKRWSREQKGKIDVSQPRLLANYSSAIGGVGLLDQCVNNYRVSIHSKKWWWPLWTHMLNVAVVNAWRLHSYAGGQIDLLSFVRSITRHYMRVSVKAQHNRQIRITPSSTIKDEGSHFPKKITKQLRCRQCHQRARWSCMKCNVTLCLERDCFVKYHSQ